MKSVPRAIFALVLFASVGALAQTPPATNTITIQTQPAKPWVPPPDAIKAPAVTGRPHTCTAGGYYPPEALRMNVTGNVVLALTITADGDVTNVTVQNSSGSSILDNAAIACVGAWRYIPATKNGQPVTVPWKVMVTWSLFGAPFPIGAPHICPASLLPANTSVTPGSRPTTVFYHIASDGSLRDVVIGQSGGNDLFDRIVVECVSQWRFMQPTLNGVPADILWGTTMTIPAEIRDEKLSADFIFVPKEYGTRTACERPASISASASDTVVLADLLPQGGLTNVRVWQSSGSKALDDFAISCVPSLKFAPAYQNGNPVQVTIPIRLNWQ